MEPGPAISNSREVLDPVASPNREENGGNGCPGKWLKNEFFSA
jgi:hypothetical protein